MAQFVTLVDASGSTFDVEPELVTIIYALPSNPSKTVVEFSDGFQIISNSSVATLKTALGIGQTVQGQYAEDSGHTSGQIGNFILAVRNDAGTSLVDATLDYAPLQVNSVGELRVTTAGGTPSGRDDTDDQAVVATGLNTNVVRNYVYDGTNWDRMREGTTAGSILVNNPTAANLQATVTGTVVADTELPAATAMADGEANPTVPRIGVENTVYNGATWDRVRSGGVLGMQGVAGAEAHDAPVTGNPVLVAGRASAVAPTDVSTDGDVARLWTTKAGVLHVTPTRRRRTGVYALSLGATTVTAAADAATGGRWWLQNPVGSTVFAAVRKIYFSVTTSTGLLETSAPTFTVERFTFTGTASGATLTPCKRDSSDAANSIILRTASTGMTITAGAAAHGFQVPAALATTSQNATAQVFPFTADEDEYIILRAGEGIVIRQATAGTALDTRIANFDIVWEEFNSTDFVVRD